MRLLAIGDIHGCATALEVLLAAIYLRAGDIVIGLGDDINKEPETKATLDRLIRLFDKSILIPLLGHYELKLLSVGRKGKPQNGTEAQLKGKCFRIFGPLPWIVDSCITCLS